MTKADIIAEMAAETGMTKVAASAAYDALVGIVDRQVSAGERLRLPDIGTFKVVQRAARKGRNPKTGKTINIPARKAVTFSVAKSLKDAARG